LPTQVFETISMALALGLLLAFLPFRRRPGQVLGLFLICYGVHRFLNEILRSDTRPEGFESLISFLVIGTGALLTCWLAFVGNPEPARAVSASPVPIPEKKT
jgi:phosphatidylglycerol:prolipoprotein diacylglycerol transferase